MFDDLRGLSDREEVFEGIEEKRFDSEFAGPEPRLFGMTALQRLVLSILLFGTIVVVGMTCLLVFSKIWFIP